MIRQSLVWLVAMCWAIPVFCTAQERADKDIRIIVQRDPKIEKALTDSTNQLISYLETKIKDVYVLQEAGRVICIKRAHCLVFLRVVTTGSGDSLLYDVVFVKTRELADSLEAMARVYDEYVNLVLSNLKRGRLDFPSSTKFPVKGTEYTFEHLEKKEQTPGDFRRHGFKQALEFLKTCKNEP